MLFKSFDFKSSTVRRALELNKVAPLEGWQDYYNSYTYTLFKIMEAGKSTSYPYNRNARAILFLMRHSLELCLKNNLNINQTSIPTYHSFTEIAKGFGGMQDLPPSIQDLIAIIDKDEDGSCYRYSTNPNTNTLYFPGKVVIETADYFRIHQDMIAARQFHANSISPALPFTKKITQWDLSFHMSESTNLWHVRSHFNGIAEILIQSIIGGDIELGKVYLPLLFLIRHSLELALKANMLDVQKIFPDFASNFKLKEHSLVTLYNCYDGFLAELDLSAMDKNLQDQLLDFRKKYTSFNLQIHDLDYNSEHFRFPAGKNGKPHVIRLDRIFLHKVLELYYFTDTFLTFTNDVLQDVGVITNPPH